MRARGGWKRYTQPTSSRRKHPYRRRTVIVIVIVIVIVVPLWRWRIGEVEVRGATIIPNAAVRDAVLVELQQRRWGLFPRSSMIWAGINDLEEKLRQRFAFARVEGKRQSSGSLMVTVTEQPIAAVARFETGSVLVAQSGQIIGAAPESLNQAAVLVIRGSGRAPSTGDKFLSEPTIEFLQSLWHELELAGGALRPSMVSQRIGSEDTYDFRTLNGIVISVVVSDQPNYQLVKLQALLRDRPTAAARSQLRSIDLRYGDRVYIQ